MAFHRFLAATAVIVLACVVSTASAAIAVGSFVHNFDMDGNYTEYLWNTVNARVWDERPNGLPVRYWAPTSNGVEGQIIYKYEFDEPIQSASIFANQLQNRPGDLAFLDISADGVNWTTVQSGHIHPDINPPYSLPVHDLTAILMGSDTAYVRSRLVGQQLNSDIFSAQFLRTTPNFVSLKAPYVYEFRAESGAEQIGGVPEPSSLIVWCCLGAVVAAFSSRRFFR